MGDNDVLLKHVAPALGCVVAFMLFASPVKAVLQVRRQRALGALNPLPMVAMWANCVGWVVYSFINRDYYVLASNVPGLLLGTFMTISCYGLADEKLRDTMMQGILFFTLLISGSGITVSFGGFEHESVASIWGTTCVIILLIFYTAPLSAVAEVLKTRSSATLYLPFACMNVVNGLLWFAYGLAVGDIFIWGPNMVGICFGGIQVLLCLIYPKTEKAPSSKVGDMEAVSILHDQSSQSYDGQDDFSAKVG
eukprot:jgi/Chrzof1/15021/Cz09g24080.t1